MSRYIDADALLKSAVSRFKCVPSVGVIYCGNGEEIFDGEDLQDFIRAIPTADVVEVRHGEWVVCGAFDDFLKCSLCHNDYPWMQVANYNYCPNCGAKMDGERKDDGT